MQSKDAASLKAEISNYFLYLGSDSALENDKAWILGSILTFVEAMIFMIVMLTLEDDNLHTMRNYGTARNVSLILVGAFIAKTGLYLFIQRMEEPLRKADIDELQLQRKEVISKLHAKQANPV